MLSNKKRCRCEEQAVRHDYKLNAGFETVLVLMARDGDSECQQVAIEYLGGQAKYKNIQLVVVPRWLGLGDFIKDLIYYFTRIRPCAKCRQRQLWLNKCFPWRKDILDLLPDYMWVEAIYPFVIDVPAEKLEKVNSVKIKISM